MRLCTFRPKGRPNQFPRLGALYEEKVYGVGSYGDLGAALAGSLFSESHGPSRSEPSYPLGEVVLSAPVLRPGKIVAAIVNTRGMLGGDLTLGHPRLDMKAPSTVIGPGELIVAPRSGVRPEVELAAVIGRRVSKADRRDARDAIFGYTVLNDVTAPEDSKEDAYEAYRRDSETGKVRKKLMRGPLFRSKNHDTFSPTGPVVVTTSEVEDSSDLRMTTRFGSTLIQDGSTSDYIFNPEELVSYTSSFLTLEPGDLVSCGSVGWTRQATGDLDPTEFVLPQKRGILELEIENVGVLRNPIVYR